MRDDEHGDGRRCGHCGLRFCPSRLATLGWYRNVVMPARTLRNEFHTSILLKRHTSLQNTHLWLWYAVVLQASYPNYPTAFSHISLTPDLNLFNPIEIELALSICTRVVHLHLAGSLGSVGSRRLGMVRGIPISGCIECSTRTLPDKRDVRQCSRREPREANHM